MLCESGESRNKKNLLKMCESLCLGDSMSTNICLSMSRNNLSIGTSECECKSE